MIQLRRILCPIDLSPISGHALDLAAAADLDVNLIVMGARARRVFGALLGSTTDSVVRHATCPVLTVGHPHPRRTG